MPSECEGIVDLHQSLPPYTSKMAYLGGSHRDSQLYWLDTQKHPWIGEKVIDAVRIYNQDTRFDIDLNLRMAQLTAYHPGQFYEWHTDLGAGEISLRKITVVVELLHSDSLVGGGLEILNQNVRLSLATRWYSPVLRCTGRCRLPAGSGGVWCSGCSAQRRLDDFSGGPLGPGRLFPPCKIREPLPRGWPLRRGHRHSSTARPATVPRHGS